MSYINTLGQFTSSQNLTFLKPSSSQPSPKYILNVSDAEVEKRVYQDVSYMTTQQQQSDATAQQTTEEETALEAAQKMTEELVRSTAETAEAPSFLRGAAGYVNDNPIVGVVGAILLGKVLAKIF